MTRFRLDLAYDGSDFHGWATQPGLRTVQGQLEQFLAQALTDLRRPTKVELTVAGRTDAGVHARGQVAHFDADFDVAQVSILLRRLSSLLPVDLVVHRLVPMPTGFDARFSALGRAYCYRLWDAESLPSPVMRQMVTSWPGSLDVDRMAEAAASLLGLRDFAAFCRPREGATTIRTLRRFDVFRTTDASRMIECWLEADAFCHSMVRSLVGAVATVGAGKRDLAWLEQAATASQRVNEVTVLAPGGLTLEAVTYPPNDQLASRAIEARQTRGMEEAC